MRIARIFNTYGPRMCLDDGRVVSNFVAQVCSAFVDNFVWHRMLHNHAQELMKIKYFCESYQSIYVDHPEAANDSLW